MKILHITSAYEPAWHLGGVVRAVSQLCRGLVELGHEVTVFTTDSGLDRRMAVKINDLVEVRGVKVRYFPTKYFLHFYYSPALQEACRSSLGDFDLVHLAAPWAFPNLVGGWGARRQHLPYVVSPHGSLIIGYNPRKFVKKWLYLYGLEGRNYHQAAAVHFTTELERQQSDALGHQAPGFIVPNGIDTAEFDSFPPKEPARKELGLPSRALLVLYFGRLEPRKALDILIGAFARAMATRPMPAYLVLAGPDFGVQGSLQELSLRLGVADRVLFPGYIPPHQRNTLLAAVDLMALVSHPGENFGISALEGMLAGLPVLLSDNVGFYRDVLSDKAGLAVPVKVEAVAQALVQMLSDPDTLTGMGKAAMASARRRYDLKVVAQQMARAYEDILSGQHSVSLSWSGVKG